ncbi:LacI family DNA-binding transcriptional regulator [Intrasporangium mesophilum]
MSSPMSGGHPHARISDVARRAGVSVGTVSNVLNRPQIVAEATRQLVHAAIEQLGFVPNASARQLRAGASRTAGVLVLDIANPFFTEVARGIEDRLIEDGLTMLLSSSDGDSARERLILDTFAQQRLRGVLLTPSQRTVDNLERLTDQGTEVVFLDHRPRVKDFASVVTDDAAGGRTAVAHLLSLGHRRIGFVNGPLSLQQCRARRVGARRAIRAADGAAELVELQVDSLDASGGELGMARLLAERPDVTGVFCVNDLVALGAMRHARNRGLDVPDELSVIGYDDVSFASELAVPLTSVRQPTYQLGWSAADLLLSSTAPRHVVFQPELVVRRSTGPASDPAKRPERRPGTVGGGAPE